MLRVRRQPAGRSYVLDGGALGHLELPEDATDRGPEPAEQPLTVELLAGLIALVAELAGERGVAR